MKTVSENQIFKRLFTVGKAGPISISLILHLALLLIIGGAVIIEQVIPKSSFRPAVLGENFDQPLEVEPAAEEEILQPGSETLDMPAEAKTTQESAPIESAIESIVVESDALPVSWTIQSAPSTRISGLGAGGGSGGGVPGGTGRGGKILGKLFGKQVEATKLGVVLDVSGSGHESLLAAMKEIDKSFENSPTIMAMGCGMGNLPSGSAWVEVYGKMKPDKVKDKPGERTSLGQLAMAEAKFQDLKKYLDRMKKRDDVYAIVGGDIMATQIGFEKLIGEGCDTIYWFCDFKDKLEDNVFDGVLKEVKARNIKVIVHNFSGDPVPERPTKMANLTGGDIIAKKP